MFHSRFNRVLASIIWLVCTAFVVAVGVSASNESWQFLTFIVFIAWLAWAGLWRPALEVTDEAVTIRNVFATTVVPWAALINVDTRYALTLVTPHGRFPATVAPAPGRLATAVSKRDMRGISAPQGGDGSVRVGDIPSSDSGAAAHLVRQRWESLLAQDRVSVGEADATPVNRQVNTPIIVISAILLVGTIAAFAFG